MAKNEIVFNSVVFGFMVNGEPLGVEFHREGKGKVGNQTYSMVYRVQINYKNLQHIWRTSAQANKTSAERFIRQLLKEQNEN